MQSNVIHRIASPDTIRVLNILLNQKCNFSCSYCYSAGGRSNVELSISQVTAVLDYFINRSRGDSLEVVFSGGGDPSLSFPTFREGVIEARRMAEERGVKLNIGMVTNGSRLDDTQIDFFKQQDIDIVISFDILEDVHNRQRSHYDVVAGTINRLIAAGHCPGIRSTITPLNVCRQVEMVEELKTRFPKLNAAAFETVLNFSLFPTLTDLRKFFDDFVDNYFAAAERGRKIGILIGNTIHNSIQSFEERACPGKLVLSSDGSLTACSRVSAVGDPHYDTFRYGSISPDGEITIDHERYRSLMDASRLDADNPDNCRSECRDCIAKWHCGGGCLLARKTASEQQMAELCRFTCKMVEQAYRFELQHSNHVHKPSDYTLLTVLPNNVCNFQCSYCYAAGGRNGSYLPLGKLKAIIDYFFHPSDDEEHRPSSHNSRTISYMGGGEPLLSWDTVSSAILYAEEKALQKGISLYQRVISNGSLISDEHIDFFKSHNIQLAVSTEIIKEVQESQRGTFAPVDQSIQSLLAASVPLELNATITPANVEQQEEMVEIIASRYKGVRAAMFEPVTGQELFNTPGDMDRFYERYIKHFFAARAIGKSNGIEILSFQYLRCQYPLDRACAGELCITADGNLTGCYCVGSPKERLFDKTCYGKVEDDLSITIDIGKYNELMSYNLYAKSECKDCIAKWHCGGGCFHQMNLYDEPYREVVCRFTRHFFETYISRL